MKRLIVLICLSILILSACTSNATPLPPSTPADVEQPPDNEVEATNPSEPGREPNPTSEAEASPYPPPLNPTAELPEGYPAPTQPQLRDPYPAGAETGAVPAEAVPACSGAVEVSEGLILESAEDLDIVGDLYLPSGASEPLPGVVLLHMLGRERSTWDNFPQTLAANCYAALTVDLRGHGETGGEVNWDLAQEDTVKLVQALGARQEIDDSRLGLIGASIGANLALNGGADQAELRTVVLLSPGFDYAGVTTEDALAQYGQRPLLIVVSEEDSYAAESSQGLDAQAQGEHLLVLYQGAGHGTDMFARQPALSEEILDWLDRTLK